MQLKITETIVTVIFEVLAAVEALDGVRVTITASVAGFSVVVPIVEPLVSGVVTIDVTVGMIFNERTLSLVVLVVVIAFTEMVTFPVSVTLIKVTWIVILAALTVFLEITFSISVDVTFFVPASYVRELALLPPNII